MLNGVTTCTPDSVAGICLTGSVSVGAGIMQALSYTQNPSAIYYGSIVPSYHQILLTEKDHCTIRFEYQGLAEGFFWTD